MKIYVAIEDKVLLYCKCFEIQRSLLFLYNDL